MTIREDGIQIVLKALQNFYQLGNRTALECIVDDFIAAGWRPILAITDDEKIQFADMADSLVNCSEEELDAAQHAFLMWYNNEGTSADWIVHDNS